MRNLILSFCKQLFVFSKTIKKNILVLNAPFVIGRVHSGGDRHSDASGGSRHLAGNVQNLHHGWGITATLLLVRFFPFFFNWNGTFTVFLILCRNVWCAAGLQYPHTCQSRGDLHHLCQPHLRYWGAWEGRVVKMMGFFFVCVCVKIRIYIALVWISPN